MYYQTDKDKRGVYKTKEGRENKNSLSHFIYLFVLTFTFCKQKHLYNRNKFINRSMI